MDAMFLNWLNGHEARYEIRSKKIADAHLLVFRGRSLPDNSPVPHKRHRHIGVGDGERLHLMQNMGRLGLLAPQKFFSSRQVEEQ